MAYLFILGAVILRLVPHVPNVAPIAAMALFGGTYLNKKYAFIIPLAAMVISDYFIGFYVWPLMASVYGSFLLIGLIGLWLRQHKNFKTIIGASLSGSILFFLITNFAVWAFSPWYPHNLAGLLESYIMGLPFFRNTLLGDLLYVGIFFGAYELILFKARSRKPIIAKAAAEDH